VLKEMAETSIFCRFALLQHICDVELRCSHGILGVAYIPEAKSRKFPSWAVYLFLSFRTFHHEIQESAKNESSKAASVTLTINPNHHG